MHANSIFVIDQASMDGAVEMLFRKFKITVKTVV